MYRTRLARTLLVLGIAAPACERAEDLSQRPLVDQRARPAVGNIGQTGASDDDRRTRPLVDRDGNPAVGNIGQTGAPTGAAAPLVDSNGNPAVGNIGQTGAATTSVAKAPALRRRVTVQRPIVRAPTPPAEIIASPLVNADERPAVGNAGGRGAMREPLEPVQQLSNGQEPIQAMQPLENPRRRPAVGNTPRKK